MDSLRLDQNRDHRSRYQTKGLVLEGSQERADRSGMAGEGDECAIIVGEYIVQETLEACFLRRVGFAHVGFPQGIQLWKSWFERVGREGSLDGGFATPSIAGVDSYCFSEELDEMLPWEGYHGVVWNRELTSFTCGIKGWRRGRYNPENVIWAVSKQRVRGLV
jgi:hypothetical protein